MKEKWVKPEIAEEYQYHINFLLDSFDKKKVLANLFLSMTRDGEGLSYSQQQAILKRMRID